MDGILHRVAAATAQIQRAEVGVYFAEVGHGRDDAVLQNLDGDHVLDADAHRMPGEALGVGDDNAVGGFAEGVAQGGDLGRGAAAAGRGERLV